MSADTGRIITVQLDTSWQPEARAAHDRAHDSSEAHGLNFEDLETLRVTWHRDCRRCPEPGRKAVWWTRLVKR